MILNNKEKKLFLSQFIRIITTIIIIYFLDIPIFMKILLIMLIDRIDCGVLALRFLLKSEKWIDCDTIIYQKSDKIIDIICYTLLLFYIIDNGSLSVNYNYLIILLFIFRLIGLYLFIIKNNRNYLFYFPNFFLEISLILLIIDYFSIFKKYKLIIILLIFVYKIIFEYYLHYNKKI